MNIRVLLYMDLMIQFLSYNLYCYSSNYSVLKFEEVYYKVMKPIKTSDIYLIEWSTASNKQVRLAENNNSHDFDNRS